jgi:hypothetical protein
MDQEPSRIRHHDNLIRVELCREAAQRFGGDWGRIQAYVTERIATMPGTACKRLIDDVGRLLAFCAPSRPIVLH